MQQNYESWDKETEKNPVKYLLCVVHTTCHFLVYIIRWFRILVLIINIRACQDCFDTSARINFILILVHKSSSSFQHITGKISVKGIWRLIRNNTINNIESNLNIFIQILKTTLMLKKFIFLYNLSESELKVFCNYTKESIIFLRYVGNWSYSGTI